MFVLRVRASFSAAHRLFVEGLSQEENFQSFGKCSSPNGHGHNYHLEVAVAGEPDPKTAMLLTPHRLERLVEEVIVKRVDHTNLNTDVEFLQGMLPTAENLAAKFWELLSAQLPAGRLYSIQVSESSTREVIYFGPHACQIPTQEL